MEQKLTDLEYSNTDATQEQVKAAICAAKIILMRPLPLTHALPKAALVGYKEEETGRYKLLKEIRVFQTTELFSSMTQMEGYVRLFALPYLSHEEYESAQSFELLPFRVYETLTDIELKSLEQGGD